MLQIISFEFLNSQAQPKPAPTPQKDQTQELNAALKAEQELANKQKANQELRNMLIREVNEFQTELYKFVTKTRQAQIQVSTFIWYSPVTLELSLK